VRVPEVWRLARSPERRVSSGCGSCSPAPLSATFRSGRWRSSRHPGPWHPRPAALARLALRFLRQSVIAGVDVAWRALDPRLPVRPGFVVYPVRLAPGPARNAFSALASLVPGTVPAGAAEGGALLVHGLDVGQPVAAQLATEEALLVRALVTMARDILHRIVGVGSSRSDAAHMTPGVGGTMS